MDTRRSVSERDRLSESFAHRFDRYQQAHRTLMTAQRDGDMAVERFARESQRPHEEAVALKRMRSEPDRFRGVRQHRDGASSSDGARYGTDDGAADRSYASRAGSRAS